MARIDSLEHFLTDVAESIRLKTGITTKIPTTEYDTKITSIETGKEPILQTKTVDPSLKQQIIIPDDGYDALSGITVNPVTNSIDSDITPDNIRKGISILGVNGSLEEGMTPSGNKDISKNGMYDISEYETVNVMVGDNPVTKGFIVNSFNTSGYAQDVTLIGITTIPNYYFCVNSSYPNFLTTQLQSLSSNDVTIVKDYAFNQSKVKTIYLPNCEELGYRAFEQAVSLTTINVDKVKIIGGNAFYGCSSLEMDYLPDTLTSIGANAFRNCKKINIKEIPSNVTELGIACFQDLTQLTEMTIKSKTVKLNNYVFYGCTNLSKIVLDNIESVITLGTGALQGTAIANGNGYIYVPDTLVDGYKEATGWKTYAAQIKPLSELTE